MLLITLAFLVIVFLLAKVFRSERNIRSLPSELVKLDTSKVEHILLYPKSEDHQEIIFTRNNEDWKIQKEQVTAVADHAKVEAMLGMLELLKPERLVARSKEKQANYELTDSLATRVILKDGKNNVLAHVYIGKLIFNQQKMNPYGSRGGVTGTTFVRLNGENEVYAVDGFLPMTFNQKFEDWRNSTFIQLTTDRVTKLTFQLKNENYILEKQDSLWLVGGNRVDNKIVEDFLNALSYKNTKSFLDDNFPTAQAYCHLLIEGEHMQKIEIQAYERGEKMVLHSSLNPQTYFIENREELFDDVFKDKAYFLGNSSY